jgi:hypothetical protein
MQQHKKTSLDNSEYKDIEKPQAPNSSSLSLAIWEYTFALERKKHNDFLVRKAKRLKALESIDQLTKSESEAQLIVKQINYLTSELNILFGFQIFADHLENAYLDSIEQIYETYHNTNTYLESELQSLTFRYNLLHESHLSTIESLLLMTDKVIQQSDQIISLKQKLSL